MNNVASKEKALGIIYLFLIKNRSYNKDLQEKFYKSIVFGETDLKEKVLSLLYHIINTQSQPNIDEVAEFFKFIHQDITCLLSFNTFVKKISNKNSGNYSDLYAGLKSQAGWGPKTAALFTKAIFHLHNNNYDQSLKLWLDAPAEIAGNDKLYLPVDAVIIKIFEELGCHKPNFNKINTEIMKYYKGDMVEVWDDLWFWGFITQKVENKVRVFSFNPQKYWALRYSEKSPETFCVIEKKSNEFLLLIKKCKI